MAKAAAPKEIKTFEFSAANKKRANEIVAKYPEGRQQSAVIPLLDIAQRQCDNWLPVPAIEHVAEFLDMPYIRAYEVATFYSMFNLKPVGKNFIQVCRTTPCWLRGSDDLTNACKSKLGVGLGEVTKDGKFTVVEVECLGACVNAPMVQINDDYFEDLNAEQMEDIIDQLAAGNKVKVGSQTGRQCSAPTGDLTSLTEYVKAKKAPAKKAAAKKPAAKKASPKKTTAKKTAAKKAPANKKATTKK